MERIELKPYPVPDGIAIPNLMPFQLYPFNGDGYLAAEVLRLKEAHGLTTAFETGTCIGSTSLWLFGKFRHTYTCEVHRPFMEIAHHRFRDVIGDHLKEEFLTSNAFWGSTATGRGEHGMITDIGSSSDLIMRYANNLKWQEENGHRHLFFLDAHWGPNCPLLDELDTIATANVKPCIVIHDFQVPGTDFGFDRFPDSGYPFCLEAIAPHLDKIYGTGGWGHRFPTVVEGAKRGWISIFPK